VLFYPGVASWEFLNGDDHRLGGREIKKGKKDCRHCHMSKEGELDLKAAEIVSGAMKMKRSHNPFEPEPSGKKGTMKARVKAAYDSENVYVKVEWDSKGPGWSSKGSPDRVSIQMNRAEPFFAKYGCFITCHNDLNTMPESPSKRLVAANPAYSGREDVRLYAFYAKSSWDGPKQGDRVKNGLIDLKSIEFESGKATSRDGWVFDDRNWEEKDAPATGSWANGKYSAVFKFRLKSSDKFDVSVAEGDTIPIAIAIHDEGAAKRKHFVSFPLTIGLGAAGEVRAVKLSN
jgi:cytochrome c-type protein NapC